MHVEHGDLTPSPDNDDVSAPTAWMPHAVLVDVRWTARGRLTGAMSFMGMTGATAAMSR